MAQIIHIQLNDRQALTPLESLKLTFLVDVLARKLSGLIWPVEEPKVTVSPLQPPANFNHKLAQIIALAEEQLAELEGMNNG
jgi:hypothetical protein